jgi:putative FmdB family regulatory protein
MPLYAYRCERGHTFDVLQRFADDRVSECEVCGARAERVLSPVAVHFKGSGFYSTDYGKKGRAGSGESGEASKNGSGGESGSKGDGKGSSSSGDWSKSSSGDCGGPDVPGRSPKSRYGSASGQSSSSS